MATKQKQVSYWEKLKDPRWQKKRLEILERDGWACTRCGSETDTLHVHHGYYEKGLDPWEYRSDTLWTLCEGCHEETTEHLRDVYMEIGRLTPENVPELLSIFPLVDICGTSEPFWLLSFAIFCSVKCEDYRGLASAIEKDLQAVCEKYGYVPR